MGSDESCQQLRSSAWGRRQRSAGLAEAHMSPMQRLGVASLAPACMPWASGIAAPPAISLLFLQPAVAASPSPTPSQQPLTRITHTDGIWPGDAAAWRCCPSRRYARTISCARNGLAAPIARRTSIASIASQQMACMTSATDAWQSPALCRLRAAEQRTLRSTASSLSRTRGD